MEQNKVEEAIAAIDKAVELGFVPSEKFWKNWSRIENNLYGECFFQIWIIFQQFLKNAADPGL